VVRSGDLATEDIQSSVHTLTTDDRVIFEQVEGLTVPAGLAVGPATLYFVLAAGLTTDAFRVSTTSGGGATNITAAGSAIVRKVVRTNFSGQGQFQINAGDFDVFGN
jgi:hypothetical protein